jgi:tetratricopeptide (TPR) repeat protein
MVEEDLRDGKLDFDNADRLPKGLETYFDEIIRRLAGDAPYILTQIFALLVFAHQPLTEADLEALLTFWNPGMPEMADALQKGLRHGHVMLHRASTPDGSLGWTLYHKEFRRRLKSSDDFKHVRPLAQAKLLHWCERWSDHQSRYALRYYALHLFNHDNPDTRERERLVDLARNRQFLALQQRILPDEPDRPLELQRLALRAAAEAGDREQIAEFCLSHALLRAQMACEPVLNAWREGRPQRAIALVQPEDANRAMVWYLLLLWEQMEDEHSAIEVSSELLARLRAVRSPLDGAPGVYASYLLAKTYRIWSTAAPEVSRLLLSDDDHVNLVQFLCDEGALEFAFWIATTLDLPHARSRALGVVGVAQAQAHQFAHAERTLSQDQIGSRDARAILTELGLQQARCGQHDEALDSWKWAIVCSKELRGSAQGHEPYSIAVAMVKGGYFEQAGQLEFTSEEALTRALGMISAELMALADPRAHETMNSTVNRIYAIEDPLKRESLLLELFHAMFQARSDPKVIRGGYRAIYRRLRKHYRKGFKGEVSSSPMFLLPTLAGYQAEAGDHKGASAVVRISTQLGSEPLFALYEIADGYMSSGDWRSALGAVRACITADVEFEHEFRSDSQSGESSRTAMVLVQVAQWHDHQKNGRAARDIISLALRLPRHRSAAVAIDLLRTGAAELSRSERTRAGECLRQAFTIATRLVIGHHSLNQALKDIAYAQIRGEFCADAFTTMKAIENLPHRVSVARALVDCYEHKGQTERAARLRAEIQEYDGHSSPDPKPHPVYEVVDPNGLESMLAHPARWGAVERKAHEQLKDGGTQEALALIEAAGDRVWASSEINKISGILVERGDLAQAREVIDHASDGDDRAWSLLKLARAHADRGQRQQALGLLEEAVAAALTIPSDEGMRNELLSRICSAQEKLDDLRGAIETAELHSAGGTRLYLRLHLLRVVLDKGGPAELLMQALKLFIWDLQLATGAVRTLTGPPYFARYPDMLLEGAAVLAADADATIVGGELQL